MCISLGKIERYPQTAANYKEKLKETLVFNYVTTTYEGNKCWPADVPYPERTD